MYTDWSPEPSAGPEQVTRSTPDEKQNRPAQRVPQTWTWTWTWTNSSSPLQVLVLLSTRTFALTWSWIWDQEEEQVEAEGGRAEVHTGYCRHPFGVAREASSRSHADWRWQPWPG